MFSNQEQSELRQAFRFATERSWSAVAWFDTEGFKDCPSGGPGEHVRMAILPGGGGSASVGKLALYGDSEPYSTVLADGGLWGETNSVRSLSGQAFTNGFATIVAHEMGHVAGWKHETTHPDNLFSDGGLARWPDGGLVWCDRGLQQAEVPGQMVGLTPLDTASMMISTYCTSHLGRGLSDHDIEGAISVYGTRPESADSDGDGYAELVDNCPYVANDQFDSNHDAELTVAVRDNLWTGTVNGPEGHKPLASDPEWYKTRWRGWYRGDACDGNAVGAVSSHTTYASFIAESPGCWEATIGGVVSKTFDPTLSCHNLIKDSRLAIDGYNSSSTGFFNNTTGQVRSFACPCAVATTDKPTCQNQLLYNCLFARDDRAPPANTDNPPYYRVTEEFTAEARRSRERAPPGDASSVRPASAAEGVPVAFEGRGGEALRRRLEEQLPSAAAARPRASTGGWMARWRLARETRARMES